MSAVTPESTLRGREVLIAEDHDELRTLIARCLRAAGFLVRSVRNGKEALDAIHAGRRADPPWTPDLIITDVQMPVLDGIQLVEGVRREGMIAPAILITAFDGRPLQPALVRLSSAFVMQKPVDLDALATTAALLC